MPTVFIAWAPECPEAASAADEMQAAFRARGYAVVSRPAPASSITDVAAADLSIFGVGASDGEYPPGYAGFVRAFSGMNLAGKAAACFSVGSSRASAGLRRHLAGTGVALFEEEPGGSGGATREWADRVAGFVEKLRDGRR